MAECIKRLGAKDTFLEQPLVSSSKFVKPLTLTYELDGKKRRWDATESHDSIGVVIYHRDKDAFLVVRQFRPAVYAAACRAAAAKGESKPDYMEGFTFELCAGILDKPGLSLEEVVSEEIQEECGYLVSPSKIETISSSISNSGTGGAVSYMFYCVVEESMKKGMTGGLVEHGEIIELLAVPRGSVKPFILDPALKRSPGLQFGLLWALHRVEASNL